MSSSPCGSVQGGHRSHLKGLRSGEGASKWPLLFSALLPLTSGCCCILLLSVGAAAVPLLPETCSRCSTHLRRA